MSVVAGNGPDDLTALPPREAFTPRGSRRKTRRPGRPRKLAHDDIIRSAIQIADQDGLSALTMSRLAAELGVAAMTLYTYIPTKDDLIDQVVDTIFGQATPPVAPAEPSMWRDVLLDAFVEVHDVLSTHWRVCEGLGAVTSIGPGAARWLEAVLNILVSAGFDSDEAAAAYADLVTYALGDTYLRSAHVQSLLLLGHQTMTTDGPHFPDLYRTATRLHGQTPRNEFIRGLLKTLNNIPDPGAQADLVWPAQPSATSDAVLEVTRRTTDAPARPDLHLAIDDLSGEPHTGDSNGSAGMAGSALSLVNDVRPAYESDGAAIRAVATQLSVTPDRVLTWAVRAGIDSARPSIHEPIDTAELARLRNENAELRKINDILRKASAYFASQLDCPSTPWGQD